LLRTSESPEGEKRENRVGKRGETRCQEGGGEPWERWEMVQEVIRATGREEERSFLLRVGRTEGQSRGGSKEGETKRREERWSREGAVGEERRKDNLKRRIILFKKPNQLFQNKWGGDHCL
jgi:hypothetical protein